MHATSDIINACFEFGSAFMVSMNVYRLWKDKRVSGVSKWPAVFFNVWGLWNLYWYPSLEQWYSFFGGVTILMVNTTWVFLAFRYHYAEKKSQRVG